MTFFKDDLHVEIWFLNLCLGMREREREGGVGTTCSLSTGESSFTTRGSIVYKIYGTVYMYIWVDIAL